MNEVGDAAVPEIIEEVREGQDEVKYPQELEAKKQACL